jgi:hypothetical protein
MPHKHKPEIKILPILTGILTFLAALALNDFFKSLFDKLPEQNEILAKALYLLMILFFVWLCWYAQPFRKYYDE